MVKKLNQQSGMPQMNATFAGWMNKVTLTVITQTIVAGFVTEAKKQVTFQGVIQPLSPKQIALKPEGQRAWKWLQIHCKIGSLVLDTGDKIVFNGKKYKIMGYLDYSLNNFYEYHAIEDYVELS